MVVEVVVCVCVCEGGGVWGWGVLHNCIIISVLVFIPGGLSLWLYEKLLCISSSLPPLPLSLVPVSPDVSL